MTIKPKNSSRAANKFRKIPNQKSEQNRNPVLVLAFFMLGIFFLAGCAHETKTNFQNDEIGVIIPDADNWEISYTERNGRLVIRSEQRNGRVRVEIMGSSCNKAPGISVVDELNTDIERIRGLYALETIHIVQDPVDYQRDHFSQTTAVIEVPINAMQEDPNRIQIPTDNNDSVQQIEISILVGNENSIITFIYLGESEQLNEDARELIRNIQLVSNSLGCNE